MKAIIISDQAEVIEKVDSTLVELGFDTIIYRWLLKALDNIEEIRADLVIVSANEYPRHWKTLAQFIASGIGGNKTKVFLLTQTPLQAEEKEKAQALGVKGFFNGVEEDDLLELRKIVSEQYGIKLDSDDSVEENIPVEEETVSQEEEMFTVSDIIEESGKAIFDSESASILFVHPASGKLITGSVLSYDASNKTVEVKPEFFEATSDLEKDTVIDLVTFEIDDKAASYKGTITEVSHSLFIKLEEELNG